MNFRIDRDEKETAHAVAAWLGENFPDALRAFVAYWGRQPGARLPSRATPEQIAACAEVIRWAHAHDHPVEAVYTALRRIGERGEQPTIDGVAVQLTREAAVS